MNKKINIMSIILLVILIIGVTPKAMQNDTYYMIAVGQNIMQNGVDLKEHFSWVEGLNYTYPHWLFDLCIATVYNLANFKGIYILTIVLATILAIIIYYVNLKINKNQIVSFIGTVITIVLLRNFITPRAQLVSFILFVLEIFIIEKFLESRKKKMGSSFIYHCNNTC